MTWHRQKVKNLEYQRKEKVEFNPPRRRRNQRAKKQSGTSSKKSPEDPKRLLLIVDRATLLVASPFAFVPLLVMVITFPSFDTTRLPLLTTFPPSSWSIPQC